MGVPVTAGVGRGFEPDSPGAEDPDVQAPAKRSAGRHRQHVSNRLELANFALSVPRAASSRLETNAHYHATWAKSEDEEGLPGVGRRPIVGVAAATLMLLAGLAFVLVSGSGEGNPPRPETSASEEDPESPDRAIPKRAYLRDACANLPPQWVTRIRRGWKPGGVRDQDLVIVPKPPSYMGTFVNTSHSAPYGFLQNVPLLFHGPGFVRPTGHIELDREVTIADLAPTYARLMRYTQWPERSSRPLNEILLDDGRKPKLIFTAVIDGGGWNVLNYWPDAWPNMESLIETGASVENAIVGSSPSITPATHTNLSTGTFPRFHGVGAIAVRADDGSLVGAFSKEVGNPGPKVMDPTVSLRLTTLADEWDRAMGNEPKIGMLAAGNLQLGMIGHGAALEGGDRDIAAIKSGEGWATNPDFYSLPEYLNTDVEGPEADIEAVDRQDGEADGKWQGHAIEPLDGSPAFAPWENRAVQAILGREGFGKDGVTDLFYVNYKAPDIAGHRWNMIGPEQGDVIESVDAAIGDMRAWLDENVGAQNYVMVVTADHGQTPLEAGGWPINRNEIVKDINARFDDEFPGVLEQTSASSFFARASEMAARGVTPEQVASFMSRYRIGDNIPDGEPVPNGFEDRTDERIFDAVFPGRKLPRIVACTGAREG